MFIERVTGMAAVALVGWILIDVLIDRPPLPIAYYVDDECVVFVNPPDENGPHSDMGCYKRRGRAHAVVHIDPSERDEILTRHAN